MVIVLVISGVLFTMFIEFAGDGMEIIHEIKYNQLLLFSYLWSL
jgi:hypothetical protein